MQEIEKLRVLIPHWIEHNQEHASEFLNYIEFAGEAQQDIQAASEAMKQINAFLESALAKLGGPLDHHHVHGAHHHHGEDK